MDILENADEHRNPDVARDSSSETKSEKKPKKVKEQKKEVTKEVAPPVSTFKRESTPEFDENKNTEQLWREGKLRRYESNEYLLGIDPLGGPAQYKIMYEDVKCFYKTVYLQDALDPNVIVGVKYSVWHAGRHISNQISKEDFDRLIQLPQFADKVLYYTVDMSDPIEGRYSYTSKYPEPLSDHFILNTRKQRIPKAEKVKENDDISGLRPRNEKGTTKAAMLSEADEDGTVQGDDLYVGKEPENDDEDVII